MNALPNIIERFRFAHHTVAMLFAAGMTVQEVMRRTGFTQRRLSLLLDDPTFQELIEHYRKPHMDRLEAKIESHFEEMESVFASALRHTRQHFEDADEVGENVPLAHAMKVVSDIGDRIGFSKHTIKTTVNVDFAQALDRAIERSGKGPQLKLIEGQMTPIGLPSTGERVERPNSPAPRPSRRY